MTILVERQQRAEPKPPVKMWQVIMCGKLIYEHPNKGMVIWWCDTNGISKERIQPIK